MQHLLLIHRHRLSVIYIHRPPVISWSNWTHHHHHRFSLWAMCGGHQCRPTNQHLVLLEHGLMTREREEQIIRPFAFSFFVLCLALPNLGNGTLTSCATGDITWADRRVRRGEGGRDNCDQHQHRHYWRRSRKSSDDSP